MELNGHEYSIGKLNARQQIHLVRKLSPLFASVTALKPNATEEEREARAKEIERSIAQNLANMKSEDVDFVLTLCLSVVKRMDNNQWTFVQAPGTDRLMYPDMDSMDLLLPLIMQVVEVNIGNFLASGLLPSPAVGQIQPSS